MAHRRSRTAHGSSGCSSSAGSVPPAAPQLRAVGRELAVANPAAQPAHVRLRHSSLAAGASQGAYSSSHRERLRPPRDRISLDAIPKRRGRWVLSQGIGALHPLVAFDSCRFQSICPESPGPDQLAFARSPQSQTRPLLHARSCARQRSMRSRARPSASCPVTCVRPAHLPRYRMFRRNARELRQGNSAFRNKTLRQYRG